MVAFFPKINILKQLKKYYAVYNHLNFNDSTSRLAACDVLLFCHDANRGISLNGKAYSPLIDSVREDLERRGLKCFSVAHQFSVLTDEKGYADPISLNRSYIIHRIAKTLLPIGLRKNFIKNLDLYNKILSKTGAQLLITIGAPDDLCEAACRIGCFHVELLHGIGYTPLPWGWGDKQAQHLPQGILSLDQISTQAFSSLKKLNIEIRTIPNPFLKRFVGKYNFPLPLEWTPSPVNHFMYKKEILVSMSWGYAGDHGSNEQYSNILENGLFFKALAEVVAESKDIFWHFRFHPIQLRERKYKHLLTYMDAFSNHHPNTEWKESSALPFPSVALNCSGNISMNSMSCYDAAAMGVSSLMLCPTLRPGGFVEDMFSDLVQEGYVIKATASKERISSWVKGVEKLPPRLSNLEDDDAWEDAVKWILSSSGLDSKTKAVA